jgi:hypothetical protein
MPVDELTPVGPLKVGVRFPQGVRGHSVKMLVKGEIASLAIENGWATIEIPSILDHEVLVIE